MTKKYEHSFELDPEWLFKEPLDFEYNKYTLLSYIQKCEKNFNSLKIYPDFIELSLHLANLQSLSKENTLLIIDKKFNSFDDEILLKELVPKKPRDLTKDEKLELTRTIRYSGNKLFETFNIAKSIWTMAFDRIMVFVKRNDKNISSNTGYSYYLNLDDDNLFVWRYSIHRYNNIITKNEFELISKNLFEDKNSRNLSKELKRIISEKDYKKLPIFECISSVDFPIENTLVPMMKRKINTYIYQSEKK